MHLFVGVALFCVISLLEQVEAAPIEKILTETTELTRLNRESVSTFPGYHSEPLMEENVRLFKCMKEEVRKKLEVPAPGTEDDTKKR
ncbi:hypothetical protein Y032_0453g1717 [Ancylostoma ceylanicum]|uniref:Uncharacterized protein n=1 Tax=Ancylostoma ceylanicum TaxID=53326 RepID=A0A016WY02_9BILA|nr:hypothetical protein Y032_0453g1717 [Ancylostoma ceylanicum]